jgi:DNA-binding CsgD family transcriptional regulator
VEDLAGGVSMVVEDDGRGFEVDETGDESPHLGLISMRERAEILGGWLQVDSSRAAGTWVQVWLPDGAESREGPSAHPKPIESSRERPEPPEEAPDEAKEAAASLRRLSPREHEVAELLALGHTNSEISSILHLSVRTIEHHRSNVFQKLGVRSRAGVVRVLSERRDSGSGK